jgi:hypothetical protein
VRLLSPDPRLLAFPAACPVWLPDGCARAADVPHVPGGVPPLRTPPLRTLTLQASRAAVAAAARSWAAERAPTRGTQLHDSTPPGFLHLRFVSRLFGFADDVYLSVTCDEDGTARLQAHSQLRLGRGDLGVNAARLRALWTFMQRHFPDTGGSTHACRD